MVDDPVDQGPLPANIVTCFLAFDPLVPVYLVNLALIILVQAGSLELNFLHPEVHGGRSLPNGRITASRGKVKILHCLFLTGNSS